MRILIGLGHPAHYHLFKNLIKHCEKNNYPYKVIVLDKDELEKLLANDNIPYEKLLQKKSTRSLKIKYQELKKANRLFDEIVKVFKPDLLVGCINQIAYIGWKRKIPSVFFAEDDFRATFLQGVLIYPFIKSILTPDVTNVGVFRRKQVKHKSYHELAYLHPNHFKADKEKIKNLLNSDKPYFILRFSNLKAYHDINKGGINQVIARKLIEILKPHGNIYITSERELESEFEPYRIAINPLDMHDALYYAQMFIGDSQTMTAEAAVLGTPALRFNDFVGKLGYLEDLEHSYQLTFGFKTSQETELFEKTKELLIIENIKEEWKKRRLRMLDDKLDFAKFSEWFVENYPDSVRIMNDNPDYQFRFK